MRTIIAGSRDGISREDFVRAMGRVDFEITTVLCGCARGVDTYGEEWASALGIPVERFPAQWDRHGRRAGFVRNVEMANAAEALVLVWDGASRGSRHMLETARGRGLRVRSLVPKREGRLGCRCCVHGIGGCPIHPERWPTATHATCGSFCREPGADDDWEGAA